MVPVDAKSGIQALDRTQPLLPIDFGKTQKRTFDYARMGTTQLVAPRRRFVLGYSIKPRRGRSTQSRRYPGASPLRMSGSLRIDPI